jgi:hypothetical protein
LTLDYVSFETLDTLLVSFLDLIVYSYVVTRFERRQTGLFSHLLMYKINGVHIISVYGRAKVSIIVGFLKDK